MEMLTFNKEPLPLLSPEEVIRLTGNPQATPEGLVQECENFHSQLFKGRGQLRQSLHHFPLPLTHCSVCWRVAETKDQMFAQLAYSKLHGDSLARITGAVFSALCGHRPPFCCDITWSNLEVLETMCRFDQKVQEAPVNPGTHAAYSYVGTSLRLLPGASLDPVTDAWQKTHGYDYKPQFEMDAAMRSLMGVAISSSKVSMSSGHLGASVVASCNVCDFSRLFSCKGEAFVCIWGQLTVTFYDEKGRQLEEFNLPSRRSVLAVVPHCYKGRNPVVSGQSCYVKRRFEERPNEIHVLRTSATELECSLVSQDASGMKRRILLKLLEQSGKILVKVAPQVKRARNKQGTKPTNTFQPLLEWLYRKAKALDGNVTIEGVKDDLKELVRTCVYREFSDSRQHDAQLIRLLDRQGEGISKKLEGSDEEVESPTRPASNQRPYFLHVPDTLEALLQATTKMVARLLAAHLGLCKEDTLVSMKSLNSAQSIWKARIVDALREAMKSAVRSAGGSRPSKGVKKTFVSYHANFSRSKQEEIGAMAMLDLYAKMHCSEVAPKRFIFMHDKKCKWYQSPLECPMCMAKYSPLSNLETIQTWTCHRCGFLVEHQLEDIELLDIDIQKKNVRIPEKCTICGSDADRLLRKQDAKAWTCRRCQTNLLGCEKLHLERCYFSLFVAKTLALERTTLVLLRKALTGHDPLAQRKKQIQSCGLVSRSTEGSASGPVKKRGATVPPELHENLLDCRAGKDANPDLRIFLLTGSRLQMRLSTEQLAAVSEALGNHMTDFLCIQEQEGDVLGRLEIALQIFCFFPPSDVEEVMRLSRMSVHDAAWKLGCPDIATCCPVLQYLGGRPVVTLICSGQELVRPVLWRPFTFSEKLALDLFYQGGANLESSLNDLHEAWMELPESGLTLTLLINAQIVTYFSSESLRHGLLKELPKLYLDEGETFSPNGLSAFQISPELESSIRTLQTQDAATWPAFHGVRIGMTSTAAITAHAPERLSDSKGVTRTSSVRSIGFGPCKSNIKNLIGSAPSDNSFASTVRSMAIMHDYGSNMLEDSMPCAPEVFHHEVYDSFTLKTILPDHWDEVICNNYKQSLQDLALHGTPGRLRLDVHHCIDEFTGQVNKPWTFVERGQALCYVPSFHDNITPSGTKKPLIFLAPQDLWVKSSEAFFYILYR